MIVKVCGMREADNIRAVIEAGADWIGLIFWPESKRYVSQIRFRSGFLPDYSSLETPGKAGREPIVQPKAVKRVGVFVDDMPQTIVTRVVNYKLDVVQLHGDESPVMIDNLRSTLDPDIRKGIKIMKTISIAEASDFAKCQLLNAYQYDVPFLLSGGIGPDDCSQIKAVHHPQLLGVDINSRFETEPAVKDAALVRNFIAELKESGS